MSSSSSRTLCAVDNAAIPVSSSHNVYHNSSLPCLVFYLKNIHFDPTFFNNFTRLRYVSGSSLYVRCSNCLNQDTVFLIERKIFFRTIPIEHSLPSLSIILCTEYGHRLDQLYQIVVQVSERILYEHQDCQDKEFQDFPFSFSIAQRQSL